MPSGDRPIGRSRPGFSPAKGSNRYSFMTEGDFWKAGGLIPSGFRRLENESCIRGLAWIGDERSQEEYRPAHEIQVDCRSWRLPE